MNIKWHRRFLALATYIATWSKDPSTKCGAVIVRPDKTIASVGFNGFPRGVSDAAALYDDRPGKLSRTIHAEMNALLHAREPLPDYTLYSSFPTCDRCAAHIIQAGIMTVVFPKGEIPERWEEACRRAAQLYAEAGIELLEVEMP